MNVSFRDRRVGSLEPDGRGGFRFAYAEEWIEHDARFPVSLSVPLDEPVDQASADAFFSNLLPEGPVRERLCRQLGISPDNRFELLRAIGYDCAGALVVGDLPASDGAPHHQAFGAGELAALLRDRPAIPVSSGGGYVRFSLAGSASKWAVVYDGDQFFWPLGAAVSSHILKVYDPRFSHGPFNEAFTGFLAEQLGLSVVAATPTDRYLLVDRYDRRYEESRLVRRHQEDAAQALGIHPYQKYQREGTAGLAQVVSLIRKHSSNPLQDQRDLITWQLANLILGNADGHLKNISFLLGGERIRLAPFYDIVCTRNYEGVERSLALYIGDGADPGHIGRQHLSRFARDVGVKESYLFGELDRIMDSLTVHLDDYAHEFASRWGDNPVISRIVHIVRTQIRRTQTLVRG